MLAGVIGYIGVADPHAQRWLYPRCPFKLLTGWDCPGCGGLRMVHDLLHGELVAALADNGFLLLGIPVLAGWLLSRRHRGEPALPTAAVVTIAVAAAVWTLLRNLPGFPLIPAPPT
nr:DUF2752 domain-containing protein [Mycobacterium botniense]